MLKKYINEKIQETANNMAYFDAIRKSNLPKLHGYKKETFGFEDNPNAFNIYEPENGLINEGLIIDVHGGAWIYGDIFLNDEYCEYLATKGYKVLSLDYPLIGQEDTNIAITVNYLVKLLNYVFSKKEELGLDFSNILLTGDSAGGHLSMLLYSLLDSRDLQEIYGCAKPSIASNKIKLLVLSFPVLNPRTFVKVINERTKNILDYFNFLMVKDTSDLVKENFSLSDVVNKVKWPEILLVTSVSDYFHFQAVDAHEVFAKNNIKHEYVVYPKNDRLEHVFNIAYHHYDESIELNNYTLEKFSKLIKEEK